MENSVDKVDYDSAASEDQKLWKPLTKTQRRVLGVLIEKSKTTPDIYPMTINGIKTGCNQKSNRSPQMELSESLVEDVLYELRHLGCVVEVHAGGRVPKYKHMAYEWLGVSKIELGVMAELLLRGEQTLGELRTRASRMEKGLDSLEDLHPVLQQLREKKLIVDLTPAGRGQIVSHNLYLEEELERLQVEIQRNRQFDDRDSSDQETPLNTTGAKKSSPLQRSDELENAIENLLAKVEMIELKLSTLQNELCHLKELIES